MKHYLDVSNTILFWHGSPTGIQRVIQGLSRAAEKEGFKLAVLDSRSRGWREISPAVMLQTFEPDLFVKSNQRLKALLRPGSGTNGDPGGATRILRSTARKAIKPIYHRGVHQFGMWMGKQAREKLLAREGRPIEFQPGDRLYIVDANWDIPAFFPALREQKKKQPGLDVIGFIYDISPISHPQFVTNEAFVQQFRSWILDLLDVSSWILADSKDAANEVLHFCGKEVAKHRFPPRAVRFGSKIDSESREESLPTPSDILKKIEAANYTLSDEQKQSIRESEAWALWVGVLHPRKNLEVQVNALDPLWKSRAIRMPLFWVGRSGSGVDDLLRRVARTPHLRANVIRLESCPDSLLGDLFRGARFSLYTSWTEGFGLPVSESLQRGCPVIASSGGSIPEVAGDLIDYFEPWDARGLQETVLKYLKQPEEYGQVKDRAKKYSPFSWEDTLHDLRTIS